MIKRLFKSSHQNRHHSAMSLSFLMLLLFLMVPNTSLALFALPSVRIQTYTDPLSCLAWDPIGRHFIAGSTQAPELYAISDNGIADTLFFDMNTSSIYVASVAVDYVGHRLIVAFVPFSVAAYDLKTHEKICELQLPLGPQLDDAPGGVAVDLKNGDVFVTSNSRGIVFKVRLDGYGSTILSEFKVSEDHGLGGIVHVNDEHNSYVIVVQATTGKIFEVGSQDGIVKEVVTIGNKSEILAPKGHSIALHSDLSLVVAANDSSITLLGIYGKLSRAAYYYDRSLEQRGQAVSVTVRDGKTAYVLINAPDGYSIVEMEWWPVWIFMFWVDTLIFYPIGFVVGVIFGPMFVLYVERIRRFHVLEG